MHAFTRDEVPARFGKWLPRSSDLVFSQLGMTSTVAFVEPDGVVLKRCTEPIYLEWLRREREVLVALEETGLPVPRLLDELDTGGEVWLVMTRLRGSSCSALLAPADPADRLALLTSVGAFLRRLHATPIPKDLACSASWIERKLEEARRNLAWCDGTPELLERLAAAPPSPFHETLIHGDLTLENLLAENAEVTGLVDWAAGDLGDPRCDVALVLRPDEDRSFDAEELDAFFSAYGQQVPRDTRRWFEDLYEFF